MPDIVVSVSSSGKPRVVFPSNSNEQAVIRDLEDLSRKLPRMVAAIFKTLGPHQLESTYQKCLKVELENAGVSVELEVEIDPMYKDIVVGHRYADLVLVFADGQKAVIEIKAVTALYQDHSKQLHFYMQALDIRHGYLVNFPRDSTFPEIGPIVDIELVNLLGEGSVDDLKPRWRVLPPQQVRIVQITHRSLQGAEKHEALKSRKEEVKIEPDVPIAKSTGKPCTICTKNKNAGLQNWNCRFHRPKNF
jgi:GxxExxY protein